MANAAPLPPPQRPTASAVLAIGKQINSATEANALRILHITTGIALHFQKGSRADRYGLFHLCFALARGIDYAITHNDIPPQAHELPSLVKQVYQLRNEGFMQSAVMVLMISVKNACRSGWFQVADTEELLTMTNELSRNFCMGGGVTSEECNALHIISLIMPRFYPRIKLVHLIISFEVKSGYEILAADFNIPRNTPPEERIRLFVAQTDNMETSSCIITPPHANFLVNGKAVDRRTNVSLDNGPQFPTDIVKMLKYGTNLIQAIGYFSGTYIVAIASMSTITSSNAPALQDYVQPVASLASDSEIIEGPSRISLTCPISLRHIRTPVKGRFCKHHQCFDYDNFMEMNSRKPSWRCPHCNQPVCCVDICIDQNMVKILKEAGEDTTDVIISADGSWKVAAENNVNGDQLHNLKGKQEGPVDRFSSTVADVVDLTMEGDGGGDAAVSSRSVESSKGCASWCGNYTCETEDRKPFEDTLGFSISDFLSEPSPVNGTSVTTQAAPRHVGDENWSRISSSASVLNGTVAHTVRADACTVGASQSFNANGVLDPVITDAVSPVLNRESFTDLGVPLRASSLQNTQVRQFPDELQLQQLRFVSSIINSEPERPSIPRHVSRTPIAVQALPAQSQIHTYHRRPQTSGQSLSSMISNTSPSISYQSTPPVAVSPDGFNAVHGDMEWQQVPRFSDVVSSSMQLHSMIQNRDHQEDYLPNQAFQQIIGLPAPNQVNLRATFDQLRGAGANRPFLQPHRDLQNPHYQHANLRTHQTNNQSTNTLPQSSRFSSNQVQRQSQTTVGMAASLVNQNSQLLAAQHAVQLARLQASRTASPFVMTTDSFKHSVGENSPSTGGGGFSELPPEQNWRPTGRMRGSLTGTAYSAALSQYMSQTTLSVPSMPPSSTTPSVASDQLSSIISNNINAPSHPQ